MKKLASILMAALLLLAALPVWADEFPHEIWEPLDRFEAAFNAGDDWGMYEAGKEAIAIMEAQPESETRTAFLAGKYEQFMRLTERLGYIDEAIYYLNKYIPYGEAMGWTDGVIYAQRKLRALTPEFEVYTQKPGGSEVYYGAKFEPRAGSYFGSVYNNDPDIGTYDPTLISTKYPKPNSMYLMYLEFGHEVTDERYQLYFEEAREAGVSLLFAWNTYTSMADIMAHEDYINRTIEALGATGLPIFLRFANEMNIGPNGDDPEAYVNAFRYVAQRAHQEDNIAMVWSPSDVSAVDRPMELYYPGDEYVDWVGVSCYIIKYFAGVRDHGDQNDVLDTYFFTNEYADPVVRLREVTAFMQDNGIEKPLMITEGGVPHYINPEGEDNTYWATLQMQRMYGELVRRYPALKAICYFNVYMPEEVNDYSLYRNQKLLDTYNQVVNTDYYLSTFGTDAAYSYAPFAGGLVSTPQQLSAVAYYPKTLERWVRYELDGQVLWSGDRSPYEYTFDPAQFSEGAHTLSVVLSGAEGDLLRRDIPIEIARTAAVVVNGETINFDGQPPILRDGRTLVPVRGVFEKLGYSVEWDGATSTATLTNGADTITVTVGGAILHNGAPKETDVPAQLIEGRTMVPLRVLSELMGAEVSWDGATSTATIVQ